jgi:hypothetical protein
VITESYHTKIGGIKNDKLSFNGNLLADAKATG